MNISRVYKYIGLAIVVAVVMTACEGIGRIQWYAQFGDSAPTMQDYKDAGVVGIDSDAKLAEINQVVEGLVAKDVDTTEEIQALVDALGFPYTITHNGTTYSTVTSPYTGKVWLDRNLGASRVCTSFDDTLCYGDYYQWGRNFDGHQNISSYTMLGRALDVNSAGIAFMATAKTGDWAIPDKSGTTRSSNWSKTNGSSVCPVGFRVPTIKELKAELIDTGENIQGPTNAFYRFLKLPFSGYRDLHEGSLYNKGSVGFVWSSSVKDTVSYSISYAVGDHSIYSVSYRANGFPVRCIKD